MVKRKILRFGGVGTVLAGLLLVLAAFVSGPVLAQSQHGDIWTQPGGTPEETSGHSQEVHLSCGNVDVWGDYLAHGNGSFTVYSWPPSDQKHVAAYQGTYDFTSDTSQKIGTIPQSVFEGIYGPHYKIQVDQDNSKFKTFWVTCPGQLVTPTISTTANPTTGEIGATLKDTAHLSGSNAATGTITFHLYRPGDSTSLDNEVVTVNGDDDYTTPVGFTADKAGTWYWVASYSGDSRNHPVTSGAQDEPVVITEPAGPNKVTPAITTTTNPSSGTVGVALNDTAHLTGGSAPTGTITFTLYKPDDTVAYQENVTVTGNADYSTVHGFTSNAVGTWHWVASYSGDTNNNAVASAKADEPVTITAATTNNPTPTPTGAVSGEVLAATGSDNWTFDLGILLMALGAIAFAVGFGAIRVRRWES